MIEITNIKASLKQGSTEESCLKACKREATRLLDIRPQEDVYKRQSSICIHAVTTLICGVIPILRRPFLDWLDKQDGVMPYVICIGRDACLLYTSLS